MITVKEAVQTAQDWVRQIYTDAALEHLRLEEVELADDEKHWNITLGWVEPAVRENALAAALNGHVRVLPRVYKTLHVDAETGTVKSMKIREVA
ncbi:MAG TPA: hypothetical protein VGB24_03155 [Longimicrobium sp.]|jgi:hypothetical protein|uniref:hypothetical protein n=1 Tax=Longimicrobium sp. TaxID=2029185 RepID=UPI002ED7F371